MDKTEKLTPEMLKINYQDSILISDGKKDSDYYKDLVYGIKKVLGLDITFNEEIEERIAKRLTPTVVKLERENVTGISDFSREFYLFYLLTKDNINDNSPNKTTEELSKKFTRKKTKKTSAQFIK